MVRNKIPTSEILVENSTYTSTSNLKARLIKEGLLEPKCSAPFCPVPSPSVNPFTGEECELKLALDHINGIRSDNRLENLRLLCYHCHGLTETWCGKNSKRKKKVTLCVNCSTVIDNRSTRCMKCRDLALDRCGKTKIDWPPVEELVQMVQESSYSAVGRRLGVSDNAVRKAIRRMKK